MSIASEVIWEGVHSRAILFNPGGRSLAVSFDHYTPSKSSFPAAQPVLGFVEAGFAALRLQTARNDWFVNPDLPELEARLSARLPEYPRAVALGFSLGGYAALRLNRALRLDEVLLISPQVSIHRSVCPWERRWAREAKSFDPVLGDLAPVARADLRGLVVFDPLFHADRKHAAAILTLFRGLRPLRLAGGDHPANSVLREAGEASLLHVCCLQDPIPAEPIRAAHRAARGRSPVYWRMMAKAAARLGRDDLAEVATAFAARVSTD